MFLLGNFVIIKHFYVDGGSVMTRLQDDFYHAINGEWEKTASQSR